MPEPGPLTAQQAAQLLLEAMEGGRKAAMLVITGHPDPERVGDRVLIFGEEMTGSFLDPQLDAAALELGTRGLSGEAGVLPGLYPLVGEGEDGVRAYLELHHPPEELVVVGAGHLAQPLCTLGALLGLRVVVLDDRPEFATRERFPEAHAVRKVDFSDPFADTPLHPWSQVILVTRGHRYDYECLRKVLMTSPLPGYVGMIGSRRRVKATFEALLREGFSREALHQVRAPIGLDIGGETPAEIAISVAAELVHAWRGGSGRPLREEENILERFLSQEPEE
jgi:xanthine dehydrogenase accessory factor